MPRNANMHAAKKNQNDEFYTQLADIENEVMKYKDQFKGKVVFCNCDDPEQSNFWKFFELNFDNFGLKKLMSTHFDDTNKSYKLEIIGDLDGDGKVTYKDIVKTPLKQNGDFRSPECEELLKEADIVVTNPPFSLFREYIELLVKHGKKFLIVGNNNAVTYKEVFKLIKDKKLWLGYTSNKTMEFRVPQGYKFSRQDGNNLYGNVPAISWFTNLEITKKPSVPILIKTYNAKDYPQYDNYKAINVNKVKDIPYDYNDVMGVPITVLGLQYSDGYIHLLDNMSRDMKYEVVGLATGNSAANNFAPNCGYKKHSEDRGGCPVINNKRIYSRILIKKVK